MIKFSQLTAEELATLADSPFAGFRAQQIPSDWRQILAVHPAVMRSDSEVAMPSGKRAQRTRSDGRSR